MSSSSNKSITDANKTSAASSSSSLQEQHQPKGATQPLDHEHITNLTEEVFRKLSEYTRAELQGKPNNLNSPWEFTLVFLM